MLSVGPARTAAAGASVKRGRWPIRTDAKLHSSTNSCLSSPVSSSRHESTAARTTRKRVSLRRCCERMLMISLGRSRSKFELIFSHAIEIAAVDDAGAEVNCKAQQEKQ